MTIALVSGQIAHVSDASAVATRNVVLTNNPTPGNFVVVIGAFGYASSPTFTVKDSAATPNTYTATTSTPFLNSTTTGGVGVWYLPNVPSGATKTITIANNNNTAGDWTVAEFSGVATSTPLETAITGTQTSTTTINTPSVTTTNAGDLVVGGTATAGDVSAVVTTTTPWISFYTFPSTQGEGAEYVIQTSAGAATTGYTQSTAGASATLMAAFKAAASANAFPTPSIGAIMIGA